MQIIGSRINRDPNQGGHLAKIGAAVMAAGDVSSPPVNSAWHVAPLPHEPPEDPRVPASGSRRAPAALTILAPGDAAKCKRGLRKRSSDGTERFAWLRYPPLAAHELIGPVRACSDVSILFPLPPEVGRMADDFAGFHGPTRALPL